MGDSSGQFDFACDLDRDVEWRFSHAHRASAVRADDIYFGPKAPKVRADFRSTRVEVHCGCVHAAFGLVLSRRSSHRL